MRTLQATASTPLIQSVRGSHDDRDANVAKILPEAILRAALFAGATIGIGIGFIGKDTFASCRGIQVASADTPGQDCALIVTPIVMAGLSAVAFLASQIAAARMLPSDAKQGSYYKILMESVTDEAAQRALSHYDKWAIGAAVACLIGSVIPLSLIHI